MGRPCNGGGRTIHLGPTCAGGSKRAIAAHEIMHAMGRYHEQARPDRDRYITVVQKNIINEYCKLL